MATLRSEDGDFVSSLSFFAGDKVESSTAAQSGGEGETQLWQLMRIEMSSGRRSLAFSTDDGQTARAMQSVSPAQLQDAYENQTRVANAYMLCRRPTDEPRQLAAMLREMVEGGRSKVIYEPSEPSFELSINNVAGGLRVQFYVDAGNVETGIYRWDAFGLRFFTTVELLGRFIDELRAEFDC